MVHEQNFLEATLCDAAIVLEGEKGTISTAISVISLGKPVLLAGIAWAKECPVLLRLFEVPDIADYEENILFEKARERLDKKTDKGPMRDLIEQAIEPAVSRSTIAADWSRRRCAGVPGYRGVAHRFRRCRGRVSSRP